MWHLAASVKARRSINLRVLKSKTGCLRPALCSVFMLWCVCYLVLNKPCRIGKLERDWLASCNQSTTQQQTSPSSVTPRSQL